MEQPLWFGTPQTCWYGRRAGSAECQHQVARPDPGPILQQNLHQLILRLVHDLELLVTELNDAH